VLWIRHLTRNLGVNLAGVRVLFELEERLGMRILETLYENRHTAGTSKEDNFAGMATHSRAASRPRTPTATKERND
jgi:hypothetical protein